MATSFFATASQQMLSVAIGWQVYEITHRPLDLGLVGLVQFLPAVLLSLVSGHVADRFDRKRVLQLALLGDLAAASLLFWLSHQGLTTVVPIYGVVLLIGIVKAFSFASAQSLLPSLVTEEQFSRAVAWSSSSWQIAVIAGPALGGLIYGAAKHASAVYATAATAYFITCLLLATVRPRAVQLDKAPVSRETIFAGLRYIWRKKAVLGSISMDLFAVLLGGAVALLPVYASDILRVGPEGLGLLRAAPGVGAAVTGLVLAAYPIERNAGRKMYLCVAIFGLATIGFGLSRNFFLSLACLAVLGAADLVSVVIRQTLVQLMTPANMRGRVNAVNMIFVGASNELGEFESGVTAAWLGVVPAVVVGGVGTILVVLAWRRLFPDLYHMDRMRD